MSRRSRILSNYKSTRLYCAAVSSLFGLLMIFVCLLGFSVIITKINAPDALVTVLSTIALCIGGYCGGYMSARKRRKNGLFMGVISGIVIFMIIVIIGTIFANTALSLSAGGKLILTMICGAVGGIIGVNTKHKRY